mgnify:CR=1 FL=1
MKITIELNTETDTAAKIAAVLAFMQDTPATDARNTARELHAEKGATPPEPDDGDKEPADEPRVYGGTSEGKARRTKAEMAQDENIEVLFTRAKGLGAKGLSKAIPTDISADDIEAELTTMVEVLKDDAQEDADDDGGFDIDDAEPAMDLDEFRAILTAAVKELGGKKVGELMSPYKSATDVPEAERAAYAEKLEG